ncbi:development-specific protein LVN1.2-like [Amphiura filiformis]|uniref:development-specific protein LVN1.2-like n=1 Tax=Amphiura filiformis TaxID=82378 RepID=UPI003B20C66C
MKLLLVLAVLVGAALAQELCCIPEEFEIGEGILASNDRGGKYESYYERRHRAYDFPKRKTGWEADIDYMNGTRHRMKLVEDYNAKSFWFIEDDKCSKQQLRSREPMRCVTINETLIRSYYVGDRQLNIDEWGAPIDHESGEKGFETRSFVRGSCIPFASSFVGERTQGGSTVRFTHQSHYEDFTKGIQDYDRFFRLPDFCPK